MLTKLLSSRLLKIRIEWFLSMVLVFALFLPYSAWCVDVLPAAYTADVIAHHGVLEAGMHFIHKPFTLPDLAVKVRKVLDSN